MKKGFTIGELILVLFLLSLLLFVLFTVITNRIEENMFRVRCSSQLRGIGQGFALYQIDFNGSNPVVWDNEMNKGQFGMGLYQADQTRWANPDFKGWQNQPTVGGCLYLLVKYEDIVPIMFMCPDDEDAVRMDIVKAIGMAREQNWSAIESWEDLVDFESMANLSYSYNDPWKNLLNDQASANQVLIADKSNAYDTLTGVPNSAAGDSPVQNKNDSWNSKRGKNNRHGNSRNHKGEYQNVLFADLHVKKCTSPTVGIAQDNIYTYWSGGIESSQQEKSVGRWDQDHAITSEDSYLGN